MYVKGVFEKAYENPLLHASDVAKVKGNKKANANKAPKKDEQPDEAKRVISDGGAESSHARGSERVFPSV